MNLIKSEKISGNSYELQFSVDAQTFSAATDKAFKREAGKYNIPGFRKGKAPRNMIEKMYGADVFHYDAINDIFPDAYEAAVKEASIDPVDRPEVDVVSSSIADGVVLKAIVTVKPDVKIGTYKGLEAEKKANTVEDAAITAELDRMLDRNSRMVTREDAAQNGDICDIDFDGYTDGKQFDGGKAEHFSLTLGSGMFIPGFEEQVVGHTAGDAFDVNVTFPAEYQATELAGKDATFKVVLHEAKYKEMPALDDEFAKDVSEYDTLAELKDSIRANLQEQADKEADVEVENALMDQVIATLKAEIPACMIETRIDEMVRDFEYRLQQQGLRLEDYVKYMGGQIAQFRDSFRENAEKQVKMRLALEAIVAAEGIETTEEDFEAEVSRIADAYKMETDKVKELIPVDEVKKDLAVNKAIDFVKENAKIKTAKAEKTAKKASKKNADAE